MMENDRFDDFIGRAARDLDPAPQPPREIMWEAIRAARQAETPVTAVTTATTATTATSATTVTGATPVTNADPGVIPIAGRHRTLPSSYNGWLRWGAPLAAMLVIGIGLGRLTMGSEQTADGGGTRTVAASIDGLKTTDAASQNNATAATSTDSAEPLENAAPISDRDQRSLATLNQPPITGVTTPPQRGGAQLARSTKNRGSANAGTVMRPNTLMTESDARASSAYVAFRMAAVRHFTRVQTLLVSMPMDVRDGNINEVAVRAADMLVNTRLLLDSPAAKDPEMHRLLDDLELILAQVATMSPTRSAEDVEIIQNAITKRDVLLRLHAITAGQRLSGT